MGVDISAGDLLTMQKLKNTYNESTEGEHSENPSAVYLQGEIQT